MTNVRTHGRGIEACDASEVVAIAVSPEYD